MTGPCNRVRDKAPGSELDASLAEHVASCEECARSLALRGRARDAWRHAKARDDESVAALRERRILGRVSDRRRGTSARTTGILVIALALLAATATAMIANRHHAAQETVTSIVETPAQKVPSVVSTSELPLATEDPIASSAPQRDAASAPGPEVRQAMSPGIQTPAVARDDQVDDGDELWRAAEAAIARGDRAGAEASLRALLQKPRESSLSARAALRLSELLLARGAAVEARERLEPLVFAKGGPIANDAVWLYARSFPDGHERADAWARFLATDPAQPMRDLASIERASALLGAGDEETARTILQHLEGQSAEPVVADALRSLRVRLDRRGASAMLADAAPSSAR